MTFPQPDTIDPETRFYLILYIDAWTGAPRWHVSTAPRLEADTRHQVTIGEVDATAFTDAASAGRFMAESAGIDLTNYLTWPVEIVGRIE